MECGICEMSQGHSVEVPTALWVDPFFVCGLFQTFILLEMNFQCCLLALALSIYGTVANVGYLEDSSWY